MKKREKKADSLMISYVLLISIVIALSIGVFAWLKYAATDIKPEINCEPGTSVIVESYECKAGSLKLFIKNNGLFDVRGVNVKVSDNPDREPITELAPPGNTEGTVPGHYLFKIPLNPNDKSQVSFGRTEEIIKQYPISTSGSGDFNGYSVKVISVQPFISDADKIIYCSDAVIKENLVNCKI